MFYFCHVFEVTQDDRSLTRRRRKRSNTFAPGLKLPYGQANYDHVTGGWWRPTIVHGYNSLGLGGLVWVIVVSGDQDNVLRAVDELSGFVVKEQQGAMRVFFVVWSLELELFSIAKSGSAHNAHPNDIVRTCDPQRPQLGSRRHLYHF